VGLVLTISAQSARVIWPGVGVRTGRARAVTAPFASVWSEPKVEAYQQHMTEFGWKRILGLMRSGDLIREARLRGGLTQYELAERTGRDRAVIARWEQGTVAPSIETVVELVRACGFDLPLELVPYERTGGERLEKNALLSPERRVQRFLQAHGKAAREA
jgi:transcriptional regulator with XRE-family HTH domain